MAAKKAKSTKQYRQAKKAAKPAAKEAFPGKVKASRKDPKIKISAEDRIALQEMKDTAKSDLGKNAYLSKADYEAERAKAREAFREKMRTEFGEYGGKKASPTEAAMKDTKAGGRTTPKTKISAKGPSLVENGKVVSLDRAKEIMSGEKPSAKKKSPAKKAAVKKAAPSKPSVTAAAKAATAGETPAKPATKKPAPRTGNAGTVAKPKPGLLKDISKSIAEDKAKKASARPTDASLRAKEDAYLKQTKDRLAKKAASAPKTEAPKPTAPKAESKPADKPSVKKAAAKPKKFGTTRKLAKFAGKALRYGAIASEVGSAVKGSTEKDWREIQRLENRLAAMKGNKPRYKNMGSNKNPIQAMTADASNLANLATLGLVGQTRRGRMDQLNRAIAKESKKQEAAASKPSANKPKAKTKYVATTASGKKYLAGSHVSSSKMNKTFNVTGAGGSTTTSKYEVKKGDTLSAIAKNAGVSLSELRSANPTIMNKPKYKKGAMIWSGTKVNIPKKK